MGHIVPLQLLRAGQSGEIVDVIGNDDFVARLAETGLRKGTILEALVPGNPFVFRVDETKLTLRTDGHVAVMVALAG